MIRKGSSTNSLAEFADYFKQQLNTHVLKSYLRKNPSGFHLCGFGTDGIPEFYFIRNIQSMNGPFYEGFSGRYTTTEDFRARDALKFGGSLTNLKNQVFYYVNGDLRNFHQFWTGATAFVDALKSDSSFWGISTPGERAKWKLEAFASFYERHSKNQIIGRPIDVLELTA